MRISAAEEGAEVPFVMEDIPGYPKTGFGWPIVPEGMRQVIGQLVERYPDIPPIYITENGAAFDDSADDECYVRDDDRTAYLAEHIAAVADARAQGADVRGYFAWSLMDNFEWAEGYTKRFGIVRVEYPTQRRVPKLSASWYAQVIRENRVI